MTAFKEEAARLVGEAITSQGHDRFQCYNYMRDRQREWGEEYGVGIMGCGLCQTRVPCEDRIPPRAAKLVNKV